MAGAGSRRRAVGAVVEVVGDDDPAAVVLWVDVLVHPVRHPRNDEVKPRRAAFRSLADRIEQSWGGRRLVRDDKDTGRLGHELTSAGS